MLASLANIFRIPDLRKKVLFTLTIIALYQFGANVPVPFVNFSKVAQLTAASKSSGVLGFLNLFSGGALTRMAVFGLGIMPYITSSIIIQLLATVIPKLEEWRDQGAVGQKKLTQTTRYLTVALALMQSTGLVYLFHKGGGGLFGTSQNVDLILNYSIWRAAFIVMTLTAGTAFVMWLAELITQRGIGQGMSILIFANVVAGIPSGLNTVLQEGGRVKFAIILVVSLGPAGPDRLRRPGPAPHSGHLRQTGGRTQDVRRLEHLHPAQGQPGRGHPDHLRQLGALHPGAAVQHHPVVEPSGCGSTTT